MPHRQPIFNVPMTVLVLIGSMIAVHAALWSLGDDDWTWWLLALAFIPARYAGLSNEIPGGDVASVTSFLTHMFVHADIVHIAINCAWLLAFGSVVCKRIGPARFMAFFACCGFAGALLFLVLHFGLLAPVIGASGAIAGLMGGVMRFLFSAIDRREGWKLRQAPETIVAMTLGETLRDRRVLAATAAFVGFNLLAIFGFGAFSGAGTIAWEAHLGGYFFGLFAFALFDVAPQRASPIPAEHPTNVP